MTYKISTLPNGLRVATEQLAGMESVSVAVSVGVGARFENKKELGISHFLEHMAFKGTKRRSAKDIAEEMDMVGGNMNAYTSLETTVYYAKVLKENTPLAVDILADILQNSVFDAEELAKEKDVILQEIAMHYDTPDDLVFDHFSATAYPNQPLGRTILGPAKQVSSYKSDDLIQYMNEHYHAPNMVVTAAGNVKHEDFLQLVGEHFSNLPNSKISLAQKGEYKGGEKHTKKKLEQIHLLLGLEGVPFTHPDYYTWQVFATILGGGMSSRLFQEVREKRGLAYTVQAFLSAYRDSGIFGIYAATSDDKAAEMLPVICEEVAKMQNGVSSQELQRAKNQIKSSLLMSRESSSAIAEWIGRHLLCYGRYKPASEIAGLIDSINEESIKKVSNTLLNNKNITITTLGIQKNLPEYEKVIGLFSCN